MRRIIWTDQAKADVRHLDKPTAMRVLSALRQHGLTAFRGPFRQDFMVVVLRALAASLAAIFFCCFTERWSLTAAAMN